MDPYSSGALLAEALKQRGAICMALENSLRLPHSMKSRFDPGLFSEVIRHDSNVDKTLEAVQSFHPTHVIAGFESGVEMAEHVGELLSLPVNAPQLRAARRDKFLMNEAARACGLRTAHQFRSKKIEAILEWIGNNLAWPVILKPPKSVASDHVFCCYDVDDVRRSVQAILSDTNVLGCKNQTVLVQEFLPGCEYAVDIVSVNGQKKTTAIWQYTRSSEGCYDVGYDGMTLLPYIGERQQALQSFAYQVLDALGITFGPAHCEIMWVDDEPVLIETAARMSAGNNAVLSRVCGGICQLDETVDAILAPDRFLASLNDQPQLQKQAVNLFLAPKRQGRLVRVHGLEAIRELPTLHYLSVGAKPGDQLSRVSGMVTLIGEDMQAIERDIGVIRNLEHEGIFEVEKEPSA